MPSVSPPFPRHLTLSLLQACKSIQEFKQIHAKAIRTHEFTNTFTATKMLEFCAVSASNTDYALCLFRTIDNPTSYTWTTMIRGFVNIRNPGTAIEFYDQMRSRSVKPNKFTYVFILKAYSLTPTRTKATRVHGELVKMGLHLDVFLHNGLIRVYAKDGDIESARKLFDEVDSNSVVTWNVIINGSFACGNIENARKLFDAMPGKNVASWNTVISGYSKWGQVDLARTMFDEMPDRDLLSWSAMISCYVQNKRAVEAVELFQEMIISGVRPDSVTMASTLSACAQIGALDMGKWIHAYVDKNKLKLDVVLVTSLVDMYAKCGCIDIALQVFHGMPNKNVFSWNAMLCGLAMHGEGKEALKLFREMELLRIKPNDITFVAVLCACSHSGLVEVSKKQFNRMSEEFNIVPKIEHYGCMIDLLGRAGLVDEAKELIRSMPMEPNVVIWGALLSAYKIHGDIDAGVHVVKHLLKQAPEDGGCYVLLSNIYAARNRWDQVAKMRKLMIDLGVERVPGCSSIELNSVVHEFIVQDKSHSKYREIYEALCRLSMHLEDEGYFPNLTLVLYDVDEDLV